jgi:hypothetical protein
MSRDALQCNAMQSVHTTTDATTKRNKRQMQGKLFDAYVQFALQVEAVGLAGRGSCDYSLLVVRPGLGGQCLSHTLGGECERGLWERGAREAVCPPIQWILISFSRCRRRVPCRCDDATGGVHFKGLPFLIKSIYKYTHSLSL